MNIEKIKEQNNEKSQIKEKKNNNLNTFGIKINPLKKNKLNNIIHKNFILKILNENNNGSKVNQIYKIRENSSKINMLKNLKLNSNEDKETKYKIKIQEKNNLINNLINEIGYYKNDYNNKNKFLFSNNLSNKNIFMYSPKNNNKEIELSLGFGIDNKNYKQFHTLDNEHIKNNYKVKNNSPKRNNIINIKINDDNHDKNENIFNKYKYNFQEMKKNKLIQKKQNNLTHENYQFNNISISKINKIKNFKLNEISNSDENRNNIKISKYFYLANTSNSNSVSYNKEYENNDYINSQKMKMKELENRMTNLMNNLFSIIEQNNKKI